MEVGHDGLLCPHIIASLGARQAWRFGSMMAGSFCFTIGPLVGGVLALLVVGFKLCALSNLFAETMAGL